MENCSKYLPVGMVWSVRHMLKYEYALYTNMLCMYFYKIDMYETM